VEEAEEAGAERAGVALPAAEACTATASLTSVDARRLTSVYLDARVRVRVRVRPAGARSLWMWACKRYHSPSDCSCACVAACVRDGAVLPADDERVGGGGAECHGRGVDVAGTDLR
jgi:hypothetical protein